MDEVEVSRRFKWGPILGGAVAILVLVLAGLLIKNLIAGNKGGDKKPPKISLMPTTPPPPPPPPKEEKKPEPPKEQKEVKMEQPVEQKVEAPPADPTLKMEGAAGDGPSMFAAGHVSSEDLSKVGTGGGGILNPFNVYATSIKGELQRLLAKRNELKRRQYRIEVLVWVTDGGRMKNYELVGSTKDADTDDAIRSVFAALPTFSEPPPAGMPQPIKLRIVAANR